MMFAMEESEREFIDGIKQTMLDCTNMTENEAELFAMRVYRFEDWLKSYLNEHSKRLHIYHHTVGIADQYFLAYGQRVLFELPKWFAKIVMKGTL